MNLTLVPGILESLIEHLKGCLPMEGCGLVGGNDGLGTRFIPVTNALASESAYEMDPGELIAALRSLRESGESMVAICHSHPRGPARLSDRDIRQAHYPKAAHVVVSLENPDKPDVRAFRLAGPEVLEVGVHVIV